MLVRESLKLASLASLKVIQATVLQCAALLRMKVKLQFLRDFNVP